MLTHTLIHTNTYSNTDIHTTYTLTLIHTTIHTHTHRAPSQTASSHLPGQPNTSQIPGTQHDNDIKGTHRIPCLGLSAGAAKGRGLLAAELFGHILPHAHIPARSGRAHGPCGGGMDASREGPCPEHRPRKWGRGEPLTLSTPDQRGDGPTWAPGMEAQHGSGVE